MNITVHFISNPTIFTELVTNSSLKPGGLYIVDALETDPTDTDTATLYFAKENGKYKTIAGGGGSGGGAQWGGEEW